MRGGATWRIGHLSPENRSLVIWFIPIAVTLYVTCLILNISMDNAELAAVIGAVGISGRLLVERLPREQSIF